MLHMQNFQKLACEHTVACNFGVQMPASKHVEYMRDAHRKLTLGLPYYVCGVATGTVAVGNEIEPFCS